MGRTPVLASVLGAALAVGAGCGRLGFEAPLDPTGDAGGVASPDAPFDPGAPPTARVDATLVLEAECGLPLAAITALPITNTGGADLTITAATVDAGFTIVTALPLVIAPGATATLEVRPPSAVIGTDRPGVERSATLTLTSNDPAGPAQVALTALVVGAELEITDADGAPLQLDLTGTSSTCATPVQMRVKNLGSRAVEVEVVGLLGFAVAGWVSGTLGPLESQLVEVRAWTSSACAATGHVDVIATGPTCEGTLRATGAFTLTGAEPCSCS